MKVLIGGDYYPKLRVKEMMEQGDYSYLKELIPITRQYDFSILNFECPISEDGEKPITKHGPALRTSSKILDSLKYAGFGIVTTANNHIFDFGENAMLGTLDKLDAAGIRHVGTGNDLRDASKILYVEKDGKQLAIINCCETEFSIAGPNSPGASPMDIVEISRRIKEAREKADYVLVITHGGHEMFRLPPMDMKRRNRFFIEMGTDAVVNHHQHVYSGYETYLRKPILYGLGNLCFDGGKGPSRPWTQGYLVGINFGKEISFRIYPYEQGGEEPGITMLPENSFDEVLNTINPIIEDDGKLLKSLDEYYSREDFGMESALQPYSNRLLAALKFRKWIPSLISRRALIRMQNMMLCESHRAKVSHYMNNKTRNQNIKP